MRLIEHSGWRAYANTEKKKLHFDGYLTILGDEVPVLLRIRAKGDYR